MTSGVTVGDYRLEKMCKHGFATPVACPICKGEVGKATPAQMVYVTENGNAFHYPKNCEVLLLGQAEERDAWLANETVKAWMPSPLLGSRLPTRSAMAGLRNSRTGMIARLEIR